jgi:predicted phosphodiesterase
MIPIVVILSIFIVGLVISELINSGGTFVAPKPFKVGAVGDWGCGYNTEKTVANIKSKDPEIIISLGDMSYQGAAPRIGSICTSTDIWFDYVKPFGKKFFIVVGNHDFDKPSVPNLLKNYLAKFDLCPLTKPEPCGETYSFNLNKVHFLVLNSEYGWEKDSSQYLLAERDLRIASSDPNTNWIVVAYHSLGYSSIDHTMGWVFFGSSYFGKMDKFLDIYHPLFDKYGVDLVLQGHVHNYQRTYPLQYEGDNSPPQRTSSEKTSYKRPSGEIYVTVGTGGVGLNEIYTDNKWISQLGERSTELDEYYLAKGDWSHYGFFELTFSNDGSSLFGTFYGNDDGGGTKVIDHFTISK